MKDLSLEPPKSLVVFAWLMLAAAGCFQLALVNAPIGYLVEAVTVDDTYLYLQIAHNWAELGFPTFDGENRTSGFQPLWSLILVALAKMIVNRELLLRSACLTSAMLNVLTAPLVLKLGKQLSSPNVAYLAMVGWCLYLFCPHSPNGMESSLHGFVFALAALVALPAWKDLDQVSLKQWVLLGFLLGLNGLCRLDSGIVSVMVACLFAWRLLRRKSWRELGALLSLPVLMVVLYFGLNQVFFGAPTPISGRVKTYWAYTAPELSPEYIAVTILGGTIRSFCHSLMYVSGGGEAYSYPWLPILLVLLTWTLVCAWRRNLLDRRLIAMGMLLLIHTVVVYALLLHLGKSYWYYQPLRIWAALLVGHFVLWYLPGIPPVASRALCVGLVLFACGFGVLRGISLTANWSPQQSVEAMSTEARAFAMASMMREEVPLEGGKVGAWNAGLVAYFVDPKVQVINLDGLVQTEDFLNDVIRIKAWKDYFEREGIAYLVDVNHQDATQTYQQNWDRERFFRGIVPFDQARILKQMGPLYLLDITPWLDSENEKGLEMASELNAARDQP